MHLLKQTWWFWPAWVLTCDIIFIYICIRCYIYPLKFSTCLHHSVGAAMKTGDFTTTELYWSINYPGVSTCLGYYDILCLSRSQFRFYLMYYNNHFMYIMCLCIWVCMHVHVRVCVWGCVSYIKLDLWNSEAVELYHQPNVDTKNSTLCTCQCVPPLSPSRAARGKTRGFDIFLIKYLYLAIGAEFLIKCPYFWDSTVNISTDQWLSDHSQTWLKPKQVKGDHVKCPTLGEGPLINLLVKALHRPGRGIVGD